MSSRLHIPIIALALALLSSCAPDGSRWSQAWWSVDQQAQSLVDDGSPAEAALLFRNLDHKAHALYAAGDFEEAATVFASFGGASGAYNRGNALVMLGKYNEAIESYDRALELRPGWTEASENRDVALARQARKDAAAEQRTDQGTDVGADAIVFDGEPSPPGDGETEEVEGEGKTLNDAQLQELWLRRVENRPGDFLRAKFASQARQAAQDAGAGR